jgi:hypothetical protein
MALQTVFNDIELGDLLNVANRKKREGWRAVQVLCTNTEEGIDMTYAFEKGNILENYRIRGIAQETTVPSLQGMFLGLFPFENEAADLFGVHVEGMVLDFAGQFYQLAAKAPMTIISPEQKAAREKAKRAAAAKAAKEAQAASPAAAPQTPAPVAAPPAAPVPAGPTPEDLARKRSYDSVEAKLASMDPARAEAVRKAMRERGLHAKPETGAAAPVAPVAGKAEVATQAPAQKRKGMTPEEREAKIAALPPEKQEKVRKALELKAQKDAAKAAAGKDGE